MQTFLPYPSYRASAKSLDDKRLGKQRVECLQVLNVFAGVRAGWGNHPITRMWKGHERHLVVYTYRICDEWTSRGYNDTVREKVTMIVPDIYERTFDFYRENSRPPWLGDPAFHLSHQSNLLRKSREYYKHHTDKPHPPHGKCDGVGPHRPHPNSCRPREYWDWYRPQFPDAPFNLDYIWPV